MEAGRLTTRRDHQQVLVAVGQLHAHQLIAVHQGDGDDAGLAQHRVIRLELGLLRHPVAGGEHQVAPLGVVARGEDRPHLFALAQGEHVRDVPAARIARALRQLVHLLAVHLAGVGEEQQVVVRRRDEEMVDVVIVLQLHAAQALPAAALGAIRRDRQALDVALVGDGDDHLLLGDEVLQVDVAFAGHDLRAPLVGVALADLQQLGSDQRIDAALVAQDRAQLGDAGLQLVVLGLDLAGLELREPLQAQVQDGARLDLGEVEPAHQPGAGLLRIGRTADQRDDLIQVAQCLEQSLEDVRAGLGPFQAVTRPAGDDVALVVEVVADDLAQAQRAGHAVHQRDGVHAEGALHRGVLVELVQHHHRHGVALELHHHTHAVAAALITQVGDLGDHLLLGQVGHLGDQLGLVHLVRELGEHDGVATVLERLVVGAPAHHHAAAAAAVGVQHTGAAHDDPPGGEVGRLDVLHQPLDGDRRLVDGGHHRVDHLAQVVRRDVGGVSHRDAR